MHTHLKTPMGCMFIFACAAAAACSTATPDPSVANGYAYEPYAPPPVSDSGGCPDCCAGQDIYLNLAVATLPWDPQPQPTDMNGFIIDVADEGILANPAAHTWLEAPADLVLQCPAPGVAPCRAVLGPLDISRVVAAGRPLVVRSRATSEASFWHTLMTVVPTSPLGDGNMLSATAYVISDQGVDRMGSAFSLPLNVSPAQGGIIALMTDPNGQLPPGARLALVDPELVGEPRYNVGTHNLRTPGWGSVDLAYTAPDLTQQIMWSQSVVSPAVFATTPLASLHEPLPAAWLGIQDGDDLISDIVPVDIVAGNLVVLPLRLRSIYDSYH